ncbi:hypothetical protein G7Y31_03080 [Corynebacterium lizhenjunii]|uniref:Uncharacterized protein n=1 Tax=Corynebacterium lizhenjunii TaxID=2709394 RepID=A0A7T0KF86_9CORY|nr:hypothetical protein [Corynebacterium lizhenjunii]QPK79703.1 hypothetical protein G7Y31_03080 [Corynebacterium lizhenjunii]
MPRIRNLATISAVLLAMGLTSGCIDLSGWDEMANLSSAGEAAISLSEDGIITIHVMACYAPLQEVSVSILGDYPEAAHKQESVRLDTPQYGYIEVPLTYPTGNDPDVINTIMNEPDRMFWVYPYIHDDGTEKYPPGFASIDGVTLQKLESYPRGTVLYQSYNAGLSLKELNEGASVLLWNTTTVEDFKHVPNPAHRGPDCVAD